MQSVHWPQGGETVKWCMGKLQDQEQTFRDIVGGNTAALAESILTDPARASPIEFDTNWGGIHVLGDSAITDRAQVLGQGGAIKWWILAIDDIVPGRSCALRLMEERTSSVLRVQEIPNPDPDDEDESLEGRLQVCGWSQSRFDQAGEERKFAGWYIKPMFGGSDRYFVKSQFFRDQSITVRSPSNELWMTGNLARNNERNRFQFICWSR